MATKKNGTKATKPARSSTVYTRGDAIGDLKLIEDYATGEMTFTVDTYVEKRTGRGGNEAEFNTFARQLRTGSFRNSKSVMTSMLNFLDREIDRTGRRASDRLNAKNMFRSAFGQPTLSSPAAAKRAR
jgi:hypothetical protein